MPTYGYECLSCDNQFEIQQSIKDDALTACAECGGTLRKRIYPVGISFKGSGFYVNDYAAKPSGGSSASDSTSSDSANSDSAKPGSGSEAAAAPSEAGASGAAKTETKPEVKAEVKAAAKPEKAAAPA